MNDSGVGKAPDLRLVSALPLKRIIVGTEAIRCALQRDSHSSMSILANVY